jgi:hypothetical protein
MRSQQIVKRSKNLSHAVHIFLLCRKSKLFGELSKHLCAHFYRRGLGYKGHKIVELNAKKLNFIPALFVKVFLSLTCDYRISSLLKY